MLEQELTERITALENEVKALRGQKYEDMKQQAADAIVNKYRLDDSYQLLVESAGRHIQITDGDTLSDVTAAMEDELRTICQRAGKPEPAEPLGMVEAWAKRRADIAAADREFSKTIESKIYRGTV